MIDGWTLAESGLSFQDAECAMRDFQVLLVRLGVCWAVVRAPHALWRHKGEGLPQFSRPTGVVCYTRCGSRESRPGPRISRIVTDYH
jgi:hypothetical protein